MWPFPRQPSIAATARYADKQMMWYKFGVEGSFLSHANHVVSEVTEHLDDVELLHCVYLLDIARYSASLPGPLLFKQGYKFKIAKAVAELAHTDFRDDLLTQADRKAYNLKKATNFAEDIRRFIVRCRSEDLLKIQYFNTIHWTRKLQDIEQPSKQQVVLRRSYEQATTYFVGYFKPKFYPPDRLTIGLEL